MEGTPVLLLSLFFQAHVATIVVLRTRVARTANDLVCALPSPGGCDGGSTREEYGTRISGEERIRVAPADPERESCNYCGGRHDRPLFGSFHSRIVQCEYRGLSRGLRLASSSWRSTNWGPCRAT